MATVFWGFVGMWEIISIITKFPPRYRWTCIYDICERSYRAANSYRQVTIIVCHFSNGFYNVKSNIKILKTGTNGK